jgi:release factor glutamine methyltransferase
MSRWTVGRLLEESTAKLKRAGIDSARLDSLLIIEEITGQDRAWLLAHTEELIDAKSVSKIQRLGDRRSRRSPLAYLLGRVDFYGLTFTVNPKVLIPRPETESLVTYLITNALRSGRVLDVGTGSGAIAVSLAKHRPDLTVVASDIDRAVLAVAAQNAAKNSVRDIRFVISDLMDDISGRFDLIAANLPYLPVGARLQPELSHEPAAALFSGPDGLDTYRRLLRTAPTHLADAGLLVLEADPQRAPALTAEPQSDGWRLKEKAEYFYVFTLK